MLPPVDSSHTIRFESIKPAVVLTNASPLADELHHVRIVRQIEWIVLHYIAADDFQNRSHGSRQ